MGYEIRFKPTDEVMEKYKHNNRDENYLEESVTSLLIYVLKDHENDNPVNVYRKIKFELNMLSYLVKDDTQNDAYKRYKEENMVWYCGWGYSHDYCDYDLKEQVEGITEKLTILSTVVKTADYYEDGDRFYDKYNSIKNTIEGFIDICREIYIYEIINDLRPFQEKYAEDLIEKLD